ncbi:hypothetical protein JW758_03555 [Candidatus Peregrinibacteria bacterium]|nr:hypothetical protein [Candidatus Peregrinibacteria bacterium]
MMDKNSILQTSKELEELFETVMKVYWEQLKTIEVYINKIPNSEEALLDEMNNLLLEVQTSMEHDIGIFSKAINQDAENIHSIQDKLKVNDIYDKLKK